uniref:Uncharacterized protein n=1 Tax=Pyxicephalus adspersus TaxID=30357 RepID=A0AAV3ABD2_PYXAD|nr:TPA: hypothetical protein GDO54_011604 [Pyxicephalus adspersus]
MTSFVFGLMHRQSFLGFIPSSAFPMTYVRSHMLLRQLVEVNEPLHNAPPCALLCIVAAGLQGVDCLGMSGVITALQHRSYSLKCMSCLGYALWSLQCIAHDDALHQALGCQLQ